MTLLGRRSQRTEVFYPQRVATDVMGTNAAAWLDSCQAPLGQFSYEAVSRCRSGMSPGSETSQVPSCNVRSLAARSMS